MKLISFLISFAFGSHFRSGSFQFSEDVDEDQNLVLTRTLNYRRGFSGYTPICWQSHVRKTKRSETMEYEHCLLQADNSTCGVYDSTYIVNDIETTGFVYSQWCYGYVEDKISKPQGPFEYYFQNCCWVDITDDDGSVIVDGFFKLYAKYNVVDNNSPQVKVPPIWRIMTGCPQQYIALNPTDKDGDEIRCRWSTKAEAKNGHHAGGNFESLTLDGNCVVWYDGTKDTISAGVKPISIQIEDLDADGLVKSSIPIQFLATVWTPQATGNMVTVTRDHNRVDNKYHLVDNDENLSFIWGDIFSHDDHKHSKLQRTGRDTDDNINPFTNNPYYCDEPPQLIYPSPEAGVELQVTGKITINLRAMYYENLEVKYDLNRFQYNSPQGIECSKLDKKTGRAVCTWLPTEEQVKQRIFDFCFLAIDKYGRDTERRCITLKMVPIRNDVHSLLDLIAPKFAYRALNDYGCVGMGSLNPFLGNAAAPVDQIDSEINNWKYCMRCAMDVLSDTTIPELPKYRFNEDSNICIDEVGTIERSVCECDHKLANALQPLEQPRPKYQNYKRCVGNPNKIPNPNNEVLSCCQSTTGAFYQYFASNSCCELDEGLKTIGECLTDVGRVYVEKIVVLRPEYIYVGDALGKPTSGNSSGSSGSGTGGTGTGGFNADKWAQVANDKEGQL